MSVPTRTIWLLVRACAIIICIVVDEQMYSMLYPYVSALSVEGLYRIPGNTAQVELLKEMFQHNKDVAIGSMDIGIHAVATALKGFFSDLSEPLVPVHLNQELVVADSKSIFTYKQTFLLLFLRISFLL